MGESIIKDGTGSGNSVKVDEKFRLHTGSVSRAERDAALARGQFFIANTTVLTLTDDSETPIFYIKNNADKNLRLEIFDLYVGASTNGAGDVIVKTYGAVDESSSIVTEAKTLNLGNANIGSQNTFEGVAYKGETGDTLVGGFNFNNIILRDTDSRFKIDTTAVLPKGSNGLFTVTPPSGNTSMNMSLLLFFYYLDENLPT